MKSQIQKKLIIAGALISSFACNTAEFSDGRKGKKPGSIEAVSCSVSPRVALPGEKVTVTVTGGSNYKGRFEQVLTGPVGYSDILVKTDGGYVLQNGNLNEYTLNKQGTYKINLNEIDYNSNLSTSCEFKVYKECPVGTERIGANVAFILDNSGSHGKSDCPGSKEVKKEDGTVSYVCNAETDREKAVNYAVEILGKVGASGGKAKSYVSMSSFPASNNPISGYDLGKSGWSDASSDPSKIKPDLAVTRKPYGMTPYGEGLKSASKLFSGVPDYNKSKVAILVTDGYPTDRDPYLSAVKARELKAQGVKIITVMVSEGSKESLVADHKKFLQGLGSESNPWHVAEYSSYDQYFGDLLGNSSKPGLLAEISNKVVNVSKASELKAAFEDIIGEQAISCE